MTEDDSLELDAIEYENCPVAKLLAEKDAQIEAQKQSLLNSWSYCESMLKDAERYRWLRSRKGLTLSTEPQPSTWTRMDGTKFNATHYLAEGDTCHAPAEGLDATIDAAMLVRGLGAA